MASVKTPDARRAIAAGVAAELTVGVAESITGGSVCAALVGVPGASAVVRGGIVAYDASLKMSLLGVSASLLETHGPVSAEVAAAMASGVREATGADVGVATTGAAGPEPHGGKAPGTAFVAIDVGGVVEVVSLVLAGDRDAVRAAVRDAALLALADTLTSLNAEGRARGEHA